MQGCNTIILKWSKCSCVTHPFLCFCDMDTLSFLNACHGPVDDTLTNFKMWISLFMDHHESLVPCIFYQSLNTYFLVMLYLYWFSIWLLYRQLGPFSVFFYLWKFLLLNSHNSKEDHVTDLHIFWGLYSVM